MRALLMMVLTAALAPLATGCTSNDPCDGIITCIALTASPVTSGAPINIDQLIITVNGQVNGTRTVPPTPRAATLPQFVGLEFNPPNSYMGRFTFTVEIVGMKTGIIVANGQSQPTTMTTGQHEQLQVPMVPGPPIAGDMALGPAAGDMARSD
jgi:hypothetical protein